MSRSYYQAFPIIGFDEDGSPVYDWSGTDCPEFDTEGEAWDWVNDNGGPGKYGVVDFEEG